MYKVSDDNVIAYIERQFHLLEIGKTRKSKIINPTRAERMTKNDE